MAITIVKEPAEVSLIGNDIPFKFWQDKQFSTAGSKAKIAFEWTTGDADGDSFTLTLAGTDVEFNCLAAEDYSGRRYPPYVSGLVSDWVQSLIPYFERNYIINQYYNVTWDGVHLAITIEAKNIGSEYTMVLDEDTSEITQGNNDAGVDAVERSGYRFICITYLKGASEDTLLGEDRLSPDSDANVFFRIQEYLKQQLSFSFTWPEPTDDFLIKNTDCIKLFYVKYGHYYDNTTRMIYSTETITTHALLGGIDRNTEALLNEEDKTWFEKHSAGLDWLTYQPRELYVSKLQPIKLSFLVCNSVTSLKLRINFTYIDGTESSLTQEIQSVSQYEVYDAILSYQKMNVAAQTKEVVSYEVYLNDQDNNRISLSRWFYIDDTYREEERIFIFQNSLGRPDVVRFTGVSEKETANTRSTSQLINQEGFTWKNFESLDYSNFEVQKFKFNTGYFTDLAIRPKQYGDYLREFYNSKMIYELVNNRLYPTRLISKKNLIDLSDESMISTEFEAERAYSDKYFSQDENIHPTQGWDSKFTGNYLNPK